MAGQAATGRGRGAVRSEAARMAILAATASQLAERGWDQLTIEGIAAAAGVGKPTIYRWWPSKSALVAEALLEGLLTPFEPEPVDTGDLRHDLIAWLEPVLALAPEETALTRYMIAAAAEDAVIGRRLDAALPGQRMLTEWLVRARERGALPPHTDIDAAVDALVGVVVIRVLRRTPPAPGATASLVDTVLPHLAGNAGAAPDQSKPRSR
ncbi:TetR/AcrR family transcriptional regulator [Microbacterium sp. W1N]|uniref:TetR/AcrR family transcriptional regulator n=1 Tax=Microbacterium festucae TaxID=2977531 RepID=UPI0021C22CB1|nr:TetR/AcrR family transcriptional regulator [Microbacterium festucae]MCT9821248.1 TetR/AcrR family transcriptional regulator [Microbacterium festucae]